jgi:ubiquitin C-terminal hydrolase
LLPNVLVLHLQRIVFNLDTLTNEKINSRLEFPIDLELTQYMLPGLENLDTRYKLQGVVVHIGAAEFGHYFSYINVDR